MMIIIKIGFGLGWWIAKVKGFKWKWNESSWMFLKGTLISVLFWSILCVAVQAHRLNPSEAFPLAVDW